MMEHDELKETKETTSLTTKEVNQWAMICHLSALTGLVTGIGFLLGPLVVWLIKKDEHPFINEQGKEAVNFQLTMFIAMMLCIPLILVIIGLFLLMIIGIMIIVFPIIAGLNSSEGKSYRYPFTIRFLK